MTRNATAGTIWHLSTIENGQIIIGRCESIIHLLIQHANECFDSIAKLKNNANHHHHHHNAEDDDLLIACLAIANLSLHPLNSFVFCCL